MVRGMNRDSHTFRVEDLHRETKVVASTNVADDNIEIFRLQCTCIDHNSVLRLLYFLVVVVPDL
jgi:hypothetical protein